MHDFDRLPTETADDSRRSKEQRGFRYGSCGAADGAEHGQRLLLGRAAVPRSAQWRAAPVWPPGADHRGPLTVTIGAVFPDMPVSIPLSQLATHCLSIEVP